MYTHTHNYSLNLKFDKLRPASDGTSNDLIMSEIDTLSTSSMSGNFALDADALSENEQMP